LTSKRRFSGELEILLCGLQKKYGANLEIDSFQDGASLLEAVKTGHYYDVICLDIQMDDQADHSLGILLTSYLPKPI